MGAGEGSGVLHIREGQDHQKEGSEEQRYLAVFPHRWEVWGSLSSTPLAVYFHEGSHTFLTFSWPQRE